MHDLHYTTCVGRAHDMQTGTMRQPGHPAQPGALEWVDTGSTDGQRRRHVLCRQLPHYYFWVLAGGSLEPSNLDPPHYHQA
jgi:hypothetical protein